jgi:nitrite reductase/ring-hydroxylating ferredoxin subunit
VKLLLLSDDPLVTGALAGLAGELGLELAEGAEDPDVVVVDLQRPGAVSEVAEWRERCPESFIAGHLGMPDRQLWLDAERAGCDLVANRGALARALGKKLSGGPRARRRRVPLVSSADYAGRLGVVHRDPASPVGPLAVYHVSGALFAVEDRCPHAGAVLSEGELEGSVLTCPRHGSQFDVKDGDRLRGPADVALRTFPLVEESGFVYLLVDG